MTPERRREIAKRAECEHNLPELRANAERYIRGGRFALGIVYERTEVEDGWREIDR